jgi:general secretion pathway protein F
MRISRPGEVPYREPGVSGVLLFTYRAMRRDGSLERGSINAPDAIEARAALTTRGLLPIELDIEQTAREQKATIRSADLALGLRLLADLLESGLPMSRALQTFADLAPVAWREAIPQLRQSVKEGRSLASALAGAPIAIPPLVIGILHAGEAGSGIAGAMRRAADVMEGVAATRSAVRSALVYPLVLATAGIGSIGILVGVVLPKFALLLGDLNHALPPSTRMLMALVAAARSMFIPSLIVIVAGLVAWTAWVATDRGRIQWHELLLGIPGIGSVRRSAASARASFALAALLESGVPIAEAMRHASRASGDAALEKRLIMARDSIGTGTGIGAALEASNALTGTVTKLIRAGEETGRLTAMLGHAARLEQDRAERIVRSSVRLIEPALVLFFAIIVAAVAAAMLQAIYTVRPVA